MSPYIIELTNNSGTDISDLTLFQAYKTMNEVNFGLPLSVSITMGVADVTYKQLLFQSMIGPFRVSKIYISSESKAQLSQTFIVQSFDSNGNSLGNSKVPTIDPYQQQSAINFQDSYNIDGFTRILLHTLLANQSVSFYIYPSSVVSF
jgi:hypothetical protein